MTKKKTTSSGRSASEDKEEASGTIDLDLGGLFRGLGGVIDLVGKLADLRDRQIEQQGKFRVKGLGDQAQGIYGFSIRSGIGGTGYKVEPFGNVHTHEKGLVVDEIRVPLVDVFDEDDEVVIAAEVPGVAEKDISIHFAEDIMTIETRGQRQYIKEIQLPAPVDTGTAVRSFNNGVLEVRIAKRK